MQVQISRILAGFTSLNAKSADLAIAALYFQTFRYFVSTACVPSSRVITL